MTAPLLQAALSGVPSNGAAGLAAIQREIKELIKFVALNYLAVVKAIKKRNRHLKVGPAASTNWGVVWSYCESSWQC